VTDTGANKDRDSQQNYYAVGSPVQLGEIKEDKIIGEEYGLVPPYENFDWEE